MREFKDRVAVVTGAASGIGLALAERFAAEGMKIVMADIEAEALESARKGLAGKAAAILAMRVDVSKAEDVERLAQETYEAFGAAHILCTMPASQWLARWRSIRSPIGSGSSG
jgi:NAD(P)-dependent dehydrogenase (short-subunit alcohol dehydrogenase family)